MKRAVLVIALGACVASNQVVCPDGSLCPDHAICDLQHHLCLIGDQGTVCDTKAHGDPCEFIGITGRCDGVCVPNDDDLDGIVNALDNCPLTANPDQLDGDADGRGDACDLCPTVATDREHDEDGDGRGDACDVCPQEPEFGVDSNVDGVGDACSSGQLGTSRLVLFDPFVELGAWTDAVVPWESRNDAVWPIAAPDAADTPLVQHQVTLGGDASLWIVELGYIAGRPYQAGDRIGVGLVDTTGKPTVSCEVVCPLPANCQIQGRIGGMPLMPYAVSPGPLDRIRLMAYPSGSNYDVHCLYDSLDLGGTSTKALGGNPAVWSRRDLGIRYFAGWTELLTNP